MLHMEESIVLVHRLNRQLVIKVNNCIKIKAKLVDSRKTPVGRVTRIFGPVKSPYALVSLNEEIAEPDKLRIVC